MKYTLPVAIALLVVGRLVTSSASASIIDVTLDTSDLANHAVAAPFYIDFTLTSSGNTVNTATISDVVVTGGSVVPNTGNADAGDSTGSLDTSLLLSDANFGYNDYYQQFNPGTALSFKINLSNHLTSVNEDTLTFSIYDQSQGPIPTLDPTPGENSLFLADLVNPGPVYSAFGSDPTIPLTGDTSGADLPASTYSVETGIPEPTSIVALVCAFPALLLRRRRKAAIAMAE